MVLGLGVSKLMFSGAVQDHGVGEADVDGQLLAALGLGAVAGAHQLQGLGEAVGHAHNHVVDQRPVQAVHGLVGLAIGGAREGQHVALLLHGDGAVHLLGQGALGALHRHQVRQSSTVTVTPRGDSDRKSSDTRHNRTSIDVSVYQI